MQIFIKYLFFLLLFGIKPKNHKMAENKEQKKIEVGEHKKGVFSVLVLGIIYDPKERKVLIGRRENDPDVPQLTWAFPGGRPEYGEELDNAVKREIREETALEVENLGPVYAKTYPEKRDFLVIYYLCENSSADPNKDTAGEELQPGDNFQELKWVDPKELENYFTTSIHPRLKEYLKSLGKDTNCEEE